MKMKLNLNVKDFDFKKFFLQYGEWVGLGVAVVIVLPTLWFGASKFIFSGRPGPNAEKLTALADNVKQKINTSTPPPGTDAPPPASFITVDYRPVDPGPFTTENPWFVASNIEDTKRRNPDVMMPSELHSEVVRGAAKVYQIQQNQGKLQVLVVQEKPQGEPSAIKKRREALLKRYGSLLARAGAAAAAAAPPGRPGIGSSGMPGGGRGNIPGAPGRATSGPKATSLKVLDLEKLETQQDVRLAEDIRPVRMAIVTGSFPLRAQMEEFRKKLRMHSMSELVNLLNGPQAPFKFQLFDIERQTLRADGSVLKPWEPYTDKLANSLKELLAVAVAAEQPDPDLNRFAGLINPGLVMARPELTRGQYPKVELEGIKKTMEALAKLGTEGKPEHVQSELEKKLRRTGIDIGSVDNPFTKEEEPPAPDKPKPPETSDDSAKKEEDVEDKALEAQIPESALLRFVDVTVEPGYTYEYRIKVKMANPNHNQKNLISKNIGEEPIIVAKEWTNPIRVEVPRDVLWYATEERADPEKTQVQFHRWVDYVLPDQTNENAKEPVGDWAILEKTVAHRGEYLGKVEPVETPVWKIEVDDYVMGVSLKPRSRKVPIDFSVRTDKKYDPALLLDFEGGKRQQLRSGSKAITEDVPVQVLILSPEGKLLVHNNVEDVNSEERQARVKSWKEWLYDVKSGGKRKMDNKNLFAPPGARPGGPGGGGGDPGGGGSSG